MDVEQFLDQPILGSFINGTFQVSGKRKEELVSPVTGKPWKTLLPASSEEAQQAIKAAESALPLWKKTPALVRANYLRNIGDLVTEYGDEFARLMAMEMGKPITQGKGEVTYAAGYFYWYAGEAERVYGLTIPSQFKEKRLMILYEPMGVCAAITPWNFPLAIPVRKIAAALAAGCTVVNKPSPESPITMLLFAHICHMAALPPGVINIIPGPEKEIGEALLDSPVVRKLSFTGSTEVGRYLYARSANTVKKLTMELGGHAPALVFDDADLNKAVMGIIHAKFRNNGQTCICPNRILVQKGIHDAFIKKFVEEVKKLKLGDPLDLESELSAILHPASVKKVTGHIQEALAKGAKAELRGKRPCDPAVLSGITSNMVLFHEETFGPVAPIVKFTSDEEGVALANKCEYGLASYIFTENLSRANRVIDALEYGIIGLNDGLPSSYQASFGGTKNSGFGREGGPTGIYEYLQEKFVSIQL